MESLFPLKASDAEKKETKQVSLVQPEQEYVDQEKLQRPEEAAPELVCTFALYATAIE